MELFVSEINTLKSLFISAIKISSYDKVLTTYLLLTHYQFLRIFFAPNGIEFDLTFFIFKDTLIIKVGESLTSIYLIYLIYI